MWYVHPMEHHADTVSNKELLFCYGMNYKLQLSEKKHNGKKYVVCYCLSIKGGDM